MAEYYYVKTNLLGKYFNESWQVSLVNTNSADWRGLPGCSPARGGGLGRAVTWGPGKPAWDNWGSAGIANRLEAGELYLGGKQAGADGNLKRGRTPMADIRHLEGYWLLGTEN